MPSPTAAQAEMQQAIAPLHDKIGKLEAQTRATSDVLEQLSTDFLDSHNGLSDQFTSLEALVNKSLVPAAPERAEIFAALAKAQATINNAEQDETADVKMKAGGQYSYSYATLASVLNAVRGPLSENGIALFQITADPGQGMLGIKTVLAHESGQTITDLITMASEGGDPRAIGSIRTYMRRYAVLAICGIAGATDDDAEAATPDPSDYERITTAQSELILMRADELFDERADAVLAKMLNRLFGGITNVGDIRAGEHEVAISNLENAHKLMAKNEQSAKDAEAAEAAEAAEK